MAAHRYWRAVGLEAYGTGDLELSCFHLLDVAGVRVDAAATITSSSAPTTGALANLQDDDLSTAARWSAQSVARLTLNWDFGGSPVSVVDTLLAGDSEVSFLLITKIQYSDDASAWVDSVIFAGITWPGVGAKTSSVNPTNTWSKYDRGTNSTISDDQLTLGTWSSTSGRGLVAKSTGKCQFEVTLVTLSTNADFGIGVATAAANINTYPGAVGGSFGYNRNGQKDLAGVPAAFGATFTSGDVIGVVVDFDVGSLTFYKNGVSQGVASATGMLGLTLLPIAGMSSGGTLISYSTLKGMNLAYPVTGVSEWSSPPQIKRNPVQGRVAAFDSVPVGTSVPIIYGSIKVLEMVNNTVQSGAIKDYTTGVLGTGRGRVQGTIKETPSSSVYRKVRLIRENDGLLIREMWSDPATGVYDFKFVDELQKFTVLSYDHTGAFRAVVADGQIPELIP
jgi:SPRY domain